MRRGRGKKCCDVGCCAVIVLIRRWEMVCKVIREGSCGISKHGEWFKDGLQNCI